MTKAPKALFALADKTRLKILKRLTKTNACACCACKLPAIVGVSQPAVSQHLKVLREAGLVEMHKDGAKRIYSLSRKGKRVLKDVSKW